MIRLGNAWVDMNAVSAVVPTRDAPGFSLFLNSGRIIGMPGVSEKEVVAALVEGGRIDDGSVVICNANDVEETGNAE